MYGHFPHNMSYKVPWEQSINIYLYGHFPKISINYQVPQEQPINT